VNLIGGQNMTFFAGNLLKGNGGYTVWNAAGSQTYGTQLDGGSGTLPGGGSYKGLVANSAPGSAYQVDQFPGSDFGAKVQSCVGTLSASYGGTCDARNFAGSQSMGSNLTISTANATVLLPCATISTASQVIVTAGTRNVALRGCALRGASTASGSQGGTVFLYSGTGAMAQVGDPTYAADTLGFHMDNVAINTTASSSATAQGLAAYRTQEMDLESLYFLGNSNQTGMTLDGTGNYTGGTFFDNEFTGFQTAVNAIGHQVSNPATTDWMNASTFVRLHIDCPTSSGSPIAGTYGINLQQGDGNTFTGGDVEGCSTALHLGPNAQNNTIVGLRNENSSNQVVADAGSSYNNWMTGGTMFTGQLTDNGTRNSFLDTFHRSFNGLNGDWYGSQQDATLTNHFRIGTGAGNERGLLNRYQTDYGYRWTMGLSDATAGEQFYQILDELNNVYRLSIGQYNNGQSSTNNQTVINSAGTGAVVLNGSNNSGTGGVVIGSGGASETTVATISNAGNAQFNGTLQVGGTSTFSGSTTVKNQADAEIDQFLWAGATTSQKESFIYKDWNGNSQWYMVKDASNNWALNSATGGLDSFKAYQSTNSGDTYINASNSSGVVRVNYETGSGTGFNIYGGNSSALYASFTGSTSIKFPGLAASSGHNCLQIDNSGYITNTGSACGSSSSGTVSSGTTGQIAYYTGSGTAIGGMNTVPLTAGGTGASSAAAALANLGGISSTATSTQAMAGPLTVTGAVTATETISSISPYADIRAYGAACNGSTDDTAALQTAITALGAKGGQILIPGISSGCYIATPTSLSFPTLTGQLALNIQGSLKLGSTLTLPNDAGVVGQSGSSGVQFVSEGPIASISGPGITGTLGTAVTAGSTATFTPSSMAGIYVGTALSVVGYVSCSPTSMTRTLVSGSTYNVTVQLPSACHIAPGYNVTVTGASDSTFNGTFIVGQADYVQNTMLWQQTASSASTATGATLTGVNDDSVESVVVTAVTSTTATAAFVNAHTATDTFGIVAVELFGLGNHFLTNINVTATGTPILGYVAAIVSMDGVSAQGCSTNSTAGLELNQTARINITRSTFAACYGYGEDAIHIINSIYSSTNGTGGVYIDNSTFIGDIKLDHSTYGGQGHIYLTNMTFDEPRRGPIVVDTSATNNFAHSVLNLYYKLDTIFMEDNFTGASMCLISYLYPNSTGIADIRGFETSGSSCASNTYFNGKLIIDGVYPNTLTIGGNMEYGFTATNGAVTETELRGEGANLSPSIIPYATLPVTQTSSWTGNANCTLSTGVSAPDGSTGAVTLTPTSSGSYVTEYQYNVTPAVGDFVLWGGWVKVPSGALATGFNNFTLGLGNGSGTVYQFDQGNNASTQNSELFITGDWWHPVAGAAQIVSTTGSASYVSLVAACQAGGDSYYQPWMIYVPASAGIPIAEIKRWRQQLLHGDVPPSAVAGTIALLASRKLYWGGDTDLYRGSAGVVQTDGTFNAINGYQVNGSVFSTGNLGDWTNTGIANGYVPIWNSSTGKWTPGAQSSGSGVLTTSGGQTLSAADTLSGLPSGCLQLPCVIAKVAPTAYSGTTSSGNVLLYTTPSGSAHQYEGCVFGIISTAGTAGQFQVFVQATSSGLTGNFAQTAGITASTLHSNGQQCATFIADASTNINYQLYASSVTGSPTIEYAVTLKLLQ
jgi:hypothetical protein